MSGDRRFDDTLIMSDSSRNRGPSLVNHDDRRATGRLETEALACDRGEILDLSKSGARLRTRWPWKEGRIRPVTIVAHDFVVTLEARCVWAVKESLLRHTIGLHFINVPAEKQDRLAEVARQFAARELSEGYREAA